MTKKIILLAFLTGTALLVFAFLLIKETKPKESIAPQPNHQQPGFSDQERREAKNEDSAAKPKVNTETTLPIKEVQNNGSLETEIDTSDWKVYRNEEYRFEVRYPEKWKVEQVDNNYYFISQKRGLGLVAGKIIRIFDLKISYYKSLSQLKSVYGGEDILNLEDWLTKKSFVKKESILTNNYSGQRGYFTEAMDSNDFFYIETNNRKIIVAEINLSGEPEDDKKIAEGIVLSLKFVK